MQLLIWDVFWHVRLLPKVVVVVVVRFLRLMLRPRRLLKVISSKKKEITSILCLFSMILNYEKVFKYCALKGPNTSAATIWPLIFHMELVCLLSRHSPPSPVYMCVCVSVCAQNHAQMVSCMWQICDNFCTSSIAPGKIKTWPPV